MGLYDYRPYVKKITNDRQIMFDCDRVSTQYFKQGQLCPKAAHLNILSQKKIVILI